MGKRDTGDRTVTEICYAIFRHARRCDPSEEPHALARTCGSVRGARGNPGPYRDGELFALQFAMKEIDHMPGDGGFRFAIPVGDDWARSLEVITLSGPEGLVALNAADTSRPAKALVLDESTGRILAILRESVEDPVAPIAPGVRGPSTRILVSRGIPSPTDWRP